jgi:hypothetical protein
MAGEWKVTTERADGEVVLAIYHLASCNYKTTLHPAAPTLLEDVQRWHLAQCPSSDAQPS